jgi:hypothetical protein
MSLSLPVLKKKHFENEVFLPQFLIFVIFFFSETRQGPENQGEGW